MQTSIEDPVLIKEMKMQLEDRHCFWVQYESTVVYFLVGKILGGWGGLAGAGIWT